MHVSSVSCFVKLRTENARLSPVIRYQYSETFVDEYTHTVNSANPCLGKVDPASIMMAGLSYSLPCFDVSLKPFKSLFTHYSMRTHGIAIEIATYEQISGGRVLIISSLN